MTVGWGGTYLVLGWLLFFGAALPLFFFVLLRAIGWPRRLQLLTPGLSSATVFESLALAAERNRPFAPALSALAASYPRKRVAKRLQKAAEDLEQGHAWCSTLLNRKLLDNVESAVLTSAEHVGNLPWALRALGDQARRKNAYRAQAIFKVVFPLITVGLGMLVLVFAVAMFQPLVQLILSLS